MSYLKLEASRKNDQQEKELRAIAQSFIDGRTDLTPGVYQLKISADGRPVEFTITKEGTLGDVKRFVNRAERRKHYREVRRK